MIERQCDHCGTTYEAARPSSKFCGPTCRQRHRRNPELAATAPVATIAPATASGVHGATLNELTAAGRAATSTGTAALALAARIDSGLDTGSALAALVKQHVLTMADALRGAQVAASPLDELRRRRDLKRSG